jgi:hypothetical protein
LEHVAVALQLTAAALKRMQHGDGRCSTLQWRVVVCIIERVEGIANIFYSASFSPKITTRSRNLKGSVYNIKGDGDYGTK